MFYKNKAEKQNAKSQLRLLAALLDAKSKELTINTQSGLIEEQDRKLLIRNLIIIIIVLIMTAGIVILLWQLQRKNLRLKMTELETSARLALMAQQENERLSMKLHDAVRPLKSIVARHLEAINIPDESMKETILGEVDLLAARLRRLSHYLNPTYREQQSFKELVRSLVEDFMAVSNINLIVTMPEQEVVTGSNAKEHLFFILQELFTNAEKHSGAGRIELSIEIEFGNLYIVYEDDGVGFDQRSERKEGLGLMHIFRRMEQIDGNAELITSPGQGVKWILTIPL